MDRDLRNRCHRRRNLTGTSEGPGSRPGRRPTRVEGSVLGPPGSGWGDTESEPRSGSPPPRPAGTMSEDFRPEEAGIGLRSYGSGIDSQKRPESFTFVKEKVLRLEKQ